VHQPLVPAPFSRHAAAMSTSAPTLPPALPASATRVEREHGPFTIEDLARALRGMPRDAAFWVEAAGSLRPVVGIASTRVRTGAGGPEASTAGAFGLVLRVGGRVALGGGRGGRLPVVPYGRRGSLPDGAPGHRPRSTGRQPCDGLHRGSGDGAEGAGRDGGRLDQARRAAA